MAEQDWAALYQRYHARVRRDHELYGELIAPDPRGQAFQYTPSNLENHVDLLKPSSKVPDELREMIDVARRLFLHAYLDYDFFNVCIEHILLTTEAVLKVGLGYTSPREYPEKSKWTLRPLLEDALKRGMLPERFLGTTDSLAKLRNMVAHPKSHTIINAAIAIDPYLRLIDIANCMYDEDYRKAEEPEVFRQQREYYADLSRQMQAISEQRRRERPAGESEGTAPSS